MIVKIYDNSYEEMKKKQKNSRTQKIGRLFKIISEQSASASLYVILTTTTVTAKAFESLKLFIYTIAKEEEEEKKKNVKSRTFLCIL